MSLLDLWDQAAEFGPGDPERAGLYAEICARGSLGYAIASCGPEALEALAGALVDSGGDRTEALYEAFTLIAGAARRYRCIRLSNRANAKQPRGKTERRAEARNRFQEKIARGISRAAAQRQIMKEMNIRPRTLRAYLSPL